MSDPKTLPKINSWAAPSSEDIEEWGSLNRDQQLSQMQDHFNSSECTTPSDATVEEIVDSVRDK